MTTAGVRPTDTCVRTLLCHTRELRLYSVGPCVWHSVRGVCTSVGHLRATVFVP